MMEQRRTALGAVRSVQSNVEELHARPPHPYTLDDTNIDAPKHCPLQIVTTLCFPPFSSMM